MGSTKSKAPIPIKGKQFSFRSFITELRKKRIIEILAAFIGGGWLILEFVHWILIDHYHFPEESLDIAIVTLICALICTLTWRIFAGVEKKARKVKLELILIPLIILITAFFDVRFIQQIREPEAEIISDTKWKNSIAVLPFANISPEEGQEYFCDGMTDEIIGKLSTLKELKVVSRTSVMRYKNTDKSIKEIGQELDVASVLEGSVRKERDDIRITAQLINVKDGFHLWSDIYDRKLERIFDVQSDVAENIVNALKTRLTPEEKKRLSVIPQIKPEAYQAYLKGRFYWNKRTGEDLRKAINYFEKAIEEEPDYALGYGGLADCYNLLSFYSNVPSKESFPMARKAALKSIALDETLAEAHNSLAYATYRYYWDFAGAEREFKRAIELNSNYASARFWHGEFLMMQGRFSEAFREMNLALKLDPVSLIINSGFGLLYYFARQPEKAVRQARKTLELDPNFAHAHSVLGGAYAYLNKFPEAIAEIEKAVELSGGSSFYMSKLGWTYAQAGKDNEAKRILEKLKELSNKHYVSPFHIACVYAGLKENDRAFDWLERAYKERDELLIAIKTNPYLDPIRTDERFSELLKKIGLE